MPSSMYMEDPMTASALSEVSGSGTSWVVGGGGATNLADEAVMHLPLSAAPDIARSVAERMNHALDSACLPASESDTTGRVVVITGAGISGLVAKEPCLEALGIQSEEVDGIMLWAEAHITSRDFSRSGFCYSEEEDEELDEGDADRVKVLATTAIMHSDLTDHFELNFTEEIVCAPVLYGGRANDGTIVAVLSMRVWT